MINSRTLEEAAQCLKMGRSTLYKLAQAGRDPAHKVGEGEPSNTVIAVL